MMDIIYIAKMIMYAHISPPVPDGCICRVFRKRIGGKEMNKDRNKIANKMIDKINELVDAVNRLEEKVNN